MQVLLEPGLAGTSLANAVPAAKLTAYCPACCPLAVLLQYMTRDEVERLLEAAMMGLENRTLAEQADAEDHARQQQQQQQAQQQAQQQQQQQQQKGGGMAGAAEEGASASPQGAGALEGSAHSGSAHSGRGLSAMQQRIHRAYAGGNGGGGAGMRSCCADAAVLLPSALLADACASHACSPLLLTGLPASYRCCCYCC